MADASYIPVKKLTDTNGDYYPLSVTKSTYTPVSIQVRNNIGGYRDGDTIVAETSLHEILVKLFWDHSLAYLTTGDVDHDGSDFYYPENTWVESTKQEAINYVNSITGSNYIIGLKINNHVFEYVSKTEAISKLNACSATDSIQHNRDYVSDNRVPSSRLVKKSILNLQNQVNDKQDSATAVTYDGINAVGSVTLPVYIDTNGVPQTITSYEGNAATATTSETSGSLTTGDTGSASIPVYFKDGVPVQVTSISSQVEVEHSILSDKSKKLVKIQGESESDVSVGNGKNLIYFDDGIPISSKQSEGSSILPVYLDDGELKRIDSNIGSNSKFIYLDNTENSNGFKESSADIGSTISPIYLDDGEFKSISGNVGENMNPVYINERGEFASISGNLGSENVPVYIQNGKFQQCSGAIGGAATKIVSGSEPEGINVGDDSTLIYFQNGVPVSSNQTIGSSVIPVYVNNGKLTAFNQDIGSEGIPVYVSNGSIVEMTEDIGSELIPIYMKDGQLTAFSDAPFTKTGDGLSIISSNQIDLDAATETTIGGVVMGTATLDSDNKLNSPILIAGPENTSVQNEETTNPFLNVVQNNNVISSNHLIGNNGIGVYCNDNGNISIECTNTVIRYYHTVLPDSGQSSSGLPLLNSTLGLPTNGSLWRTSSELQIGDSILWHKQGTTVSSADWITISNIITLTSTSELPIGGSQDGIVYYINDENLSEEERYRGWNNEKNEWTICYQLNDYGHSVRPSYPSTLGTAYYVNDNMIADHWFWDNVKWTRGSSNKWIWYREWSDGWTEQGGIFRFVGSSIASSELSKTIYFQTSYSTSYYQMSAQEDHSTNNVYYFTCTPANKEQGQITLYIKDTQNEPHFDSNNGGLIYWEAKGNTRS